MQPYFFPYIGYFQLIHAVNQFIVYDNIQYTKKGWINRNRFLKKGKDELFSIPLKKNSAFLDIKDREVASHFKKEKFLNQLREAYGRAPHFEPVFLLVEKIVLQNEINLFNYIYNSIRDICEYLAIDTEILVSSYLQIDHSLHGKDKVVTLCKHVGADVYINSIGGQELYKKEEFSTYGIELKFLKTKTFEYKQFSNEFVPWLSILDVMMFNSVGDIRNYLATGYKLI